MLLYTAPLVPEELLINDPPLPVTNEPRKIIFPLRMHIPDIPIYPGLACKGRGSDQGLHGDYCLHMHCISVEFVFYQDIQQQEIHHIGGGR